jgi:hypothetical protein
LSINIAQFFKHLNSRYLLTLDFSSISTKGLVDHINRGCISIPNFLERTESIRDWLLNELNSIFRKVLFSGNIWIIFSPRPERGSTWSKIMENNKDN